MNERRRNIFILLLVLGLIAASAVVVSTKQTRLGLDLKGGVELVYQAKPTPQVPTVTPDALDRALEILRKRVDALGVAEPEIQRSGADQISIGLPAVKNAERAQEQVGTTAQLFLYDWEASVIGPDGRTGPEAALSPDFQVAIQAPLTEYEAVKRASERPIQNDGDNSTKDPALYAFDKAKKKLAGPEDTREELVEAAEGKKLPPDVEILTIQPGTIVVRAEAPENQPEDVQFNRFFVVNDDPALTGTDIKNPEQNFDSGPSGGGQPNVTMEFTDKGRKAFQEVTRDLAERGSALVVPGTPSQSRDLQTFGIVLDGEIVSRPSIDFQDLPDGIDGRDGAQINGDFKIQEAQDLASFLKIGALPVKLELISQSQVSASLGQQALDQGLLAGLIGFTLIALFLLAFYRILGAIAVTALAIYGLYFFMLIKLIPITLTLPGLAGLILTLGVAADANIVIFERVKEEVRAGASTRAAIARGYKKGLTAIIDANVVTVMVAFILFILATAGVKGFAFTLGVGTLVSLFTAVLATQAILGTMGRSQILQKPSALGAAKPKSNRFRFDYMGASKWFFSASGLILLIGALSIGGKGLNFGIDFESGTRIKTALTKPADEDAVRSVMAGAGFADAKIQKVDDPEIGRNVFQISTSTLQPSKVQDVRDLLDKQYGVGDTFSNESIGPTFGETVARGAIIAIIASLLVISAYIALRFQWKYAVPVLIALAHDLLITAGVYSLVGAEVTTATVAALLTILGFSLYDTIIVFDRIRENVPRMPRAAFSQIVNRSMSEVLARSLATSFCVGLPIMSLMFFGGETLQDFALALLVGTISGTYSSIFIAGPVLTHWKEREVTYRTRMATIAAENGGIVPPYADDNADVDPDRGPSTPRARLTSPDDPTAVSADEFEQMKRDIADEVAGPAGVADRAARRERRRRRQTVPPTAPAAGNGAGTDDDLGAIQSGAADASIEDVENAKPAETPRTPPRKPRNKRHGRPN